MSKKKPPQHTVRELMPIISFRDDAWDHDRISEEMSEFDDDDDGRWHPIVAYRAGLHRFDLDVEGGNGKCPRDYLIDTPTIFWSKRMSMSELSACLDRGDHGGRQWSFHIAAKRIENGPPDLVFDPGSKPAREAQVNAVAEVFGADVIYDVGKMVISGSRSPTPSEGKPSGSTLGDT